jgi:hypothetical protein
MECSIQDGRPPSLFGDNPVQSTDTANTPPTAPIPPESTYLDLNRLQVGDVLLFRGQETFSRAVAAGSADASDDVRYNHAAFVVDRFSWLEATRTGIGYRHPLLAKIEVDGGVHRYLYHLEHGVVVGVFRHPDFSPDDAGRVAKQMVHEFNEVVGLPYPNLLALAKAAKTGFQWLGEFLRAIGHLMTQPTRDGKRGLFCSQLVASIYGRLLKVPLFWDDAKTPEEISPASLGNPAVCRLQPIHGCVVQERADLPDTIVESAQKFRDPRLGQRAESLKRGVVRARLTGILDDETIELTEETAMAIHQFALEAAAHRSSLQSSLQER